MVSVKEIRYGNKDDRDDYTPVGRMTVVRIEYLSIFTIASWTIIRRFQLLSFQDSSDFFEQMYDNDYPLTFVRQ